MEHALREYSRQKLASIFGDGPGVRNAEKSVYNWAVNTTRGSSDVASWENKLFRWRYQNKIAHLLAELKRGEAPEISLKIEGDYIHVNIRVIPQLVWNLKHKHLEMRKLATYQPEVLWPEGPCAKTILKQKEKELAIERAKAQEKDYEGLFKCGKCKSTKTIYYQLQTRSADEPMVRFLLFTLILATFSDAHSSTDHLRHVQELWAQVEVLTTSRYY